MYTLIRSTDGKITLRTHVPPASLPADAARGLLRALEPVIGELKRIAADEGMEVPEMPTRQAAISGLRARAEGPVRIRAERDPPSRQPGVPLP